MIDMTIKLGPSTNPFPNMITTELHVCKQQHMPTASFPSFYCNTLVDIMYMKVHKHLGFDGSMCTHVFKTIYSMCKQQQTS